MSLLSYVRDLYALETLDNRFVTSSSSPPAAAASARLDPAKRAPEDAARLATRDGRAKLASKAQPALWNTPEFYFYAIVVGIAVPSMIWTVYNVSKPTDPHYKNYEHLLSPGWLLGRKVDNSDGQYASFRDNLPYTSALLILHPLLRRLYNKVIPTSGIPVPATSSPAIAAGARFEQGITFDRYFGLVLLAVLNGASIFKIMLILYINYAIAHKLPRQYIPTGTWVFNIAILFANELSRGYPYEHIARVLLPLGADKSGRNWGSVLDSYGGLMPRWEVLFKITILRMISYNMDYYWSKAPSAAKSLEKKQLDPAALSERDRVDISAAPSHYNWRVYLAYIIYSPLYLAGPILTFNDYVSQRHYPLAHNTWSRVMQYGVRFLVCLLCMEVIIHFLYAVAISKSTPDWSVYGPMQVGMIGFFNLHHIWLKLLLPWRFFRLWSLADGIDPPENMVRCMSDNYSALAFWRGWHRSFNRWIVRYVYVPLGGAGGPSTRGKFGMARSIFNYLVVFTFVACWHDINLRLLVWGWMVVFFIAPEILAGLAFPAKRWENNKTAYRILCGIGGAANVFMMMAANLVGFAVGVDGLQKMIQGIVGSWAGISYIMLAFFVLYTGVQVMMEHRQEELRHGINLRT